MKCDSTVIDSFYQLEWNDSRQEVKLMAFSLPRQYFTEQTGWLWLIHLFIPLTYGAQCWPCRYYYIAMELLYPRDIKSLVIIIILVFGLTNATTYSGERMLWSATSYEFLLLSSVKMKGYKCWSLAKSGDIWAKDQLGPRKCQRQLRPTISMELSRATGAASSLFS